MTTNCDVMGQALAATYRIWKRETLLLPVTCEKGLNDGMFVGYSVSRRGIGNTREGVEGYGIREIAEESQTAP